MEHTGRRIRLGDRIVALVAAMATALTMVVIPTEPAGAITLAVCPTGCAYTTIADAVAAAGDGDSISVGVGTYSETLTITEDVTLKRAEASGTVTIDGGDAGTVVTVAPGAVVTIADMTIRNGTAINGGGILNEGDLTLNRVNVFESVAVDPAAAGIGRGGGIYNVGTLRLDGGAVTSNSGELGGGIANLGSLTVSSTSISGNFADSRLGGGGGGIANIGSAATATIEGAVLQANVAGDGTTSGRGGGALWMNGGTVVIEGSIMRLNRSDFEAGGIYASGSRTDLTIRRSILDLSQSAASAGIFSRSSATIRVEDSTIGPGNVAASGPGGGLRVGSTSTVTMVNSTISGNSAAGSGGGGAYVQGTLVFDSVTVADNDASDGGGVLVSGSSGASLTAENSIIANNTATVSAPDCWGAVTTATVLLVANTDSCSVSGPTVVTDPQLGVLADNGGFTSTHLPAATSPAVDAGITSLTTDQRGLARPSGGATDIGSVEVQQSTEPGDEVDPTWPSGSLRVSDIRTGRITLQWQGWADNVGVTEFEVSQDGVPIATVPAPTDSLTVGGLTPETSFTFSVQALDAAGNRSSDGPVASVRTLPLGDTFRLPPPTAPSLGWQDDVPTGLIELSRAAGEVLVVASSGAKDPVIVQVPFLVPTLLDVDRDGIDDVEVTLALDSTLSPRLDVDRLVVPGPVDAQVLAFVPLPESVRTAAGVATLVVGIGTVEPGGAPGGYLPDLESIRADWDTVGGLDHQVKLGFDTVGAPNPLQFFGGVVESTVTSRNPDVAAVELVAMEVSPVPSNIEIAVSTDVDEVSADDPQIGLGWTWQAPADEPEPDVVFSLLESERRLRDGSAEHDTRVVVEDMDPFTSLSVDLVPDDSLTLRLLHEDPTDGSPTTLERVAVEHRRADGLEVIAELVDLGGPELVAMIDDGTGTLTVTNSQPIDMRLRASRPGNGFFGGAFSNPVDEVFARISETSGVTVTSGPDGNAAVDFATGFGDLLLVASNDLDAPLLPDAQNWPGGRPEMWPAPSASDRQVMFGLYDAGDGTSMALRLDAAGGFVVDLDPETLTQTLAVDISDRIAPEANLHAALQLEGGATEADDITIECTARLPHGPASVAVVPQEQISLLSGGVGENLVCRGDGGPLRYSVSVGSFAPVTNVVFDLDEDETGSVGVSATDESGDVITLEDVVVIIESDVGLTGEDPLGVPANRLALGATVLPNSSIEWARTGGATGFSVGTFEGPIEDLRFVLTATPERFSGETFFDPSFEGLPLGPHGRLIPAFLGTDNHSFHLWDTHGAKVLAAGSAVTTGFDVEINGEGEVTTALATVDEREFIADLRLAGGTHLDGELIGDCRLQIPNARLNGFDIAPPSRIDLSTTAPEGFGALDCGLRFATGGQAWQVFADGAELPSGTGLVADLAGGSVSLVADAQPIGHLGIEILSQQPFADGPFSTPLQTLAFRADEANTLAVDWASSEGSAEISANTTPAGPATLQVRVGDRFARGLLGDPLAGHAVELSDADGEEAPSSVYLRAADLVSASFVHDQDAFDPLVVSMDTSQVHPLLVQAELGFDSALTPDGRDGDPIAIDARVFVDQFATPATFLSDLQARHRLVTDLAGADLHASIIIDEVDGEEEHPLLRVYIRAVDIPTEVGVDGFAPLSDDNSVAIVQLAGPMDSLDVVLLDDSGVFDTGSERIRVHGFDIPADLTVILDDRLASTVESEFDGRLAIRSRLSGRIGRLILEADRAEGADQQLGSPYAHITVDVFDVPQAIDVVLTGDAANDILDATVLAKGAPAPGRSINPDDRVGRIDVLLETKPRDVDDDRGAPLLRYSQDDFTIVQRSPYERYVDDRFWMDGVEQRLDALDGRGFALDVSEQPVPRPADGLGGDSPTRTRPTQDHLIVDLAEGMYAIGLSNLHTVEVHLSASERRGSLQRPPGGAAGPLYVAFEERRRQLYEPIHLPDFGNDPKAPTTRGMTARWWTFFIDGGNPTYKLNVLGQVVDCPRTGPQDDRTCKDGESIDETTLEIVGKSSDGTLEVTDDHRIAFTPDDPDFVGGTLIVFSVCDVGGDCGIYVAELVISEFWTGGTYVELTDQPEKVDVFVDGEIRYDYELDGFGEPVPVDDSEEFVPLRAGYEVEDTLFDVDVFVGARVPPPVSVSPVSTRLRLIDAPNAVTYRLPDPLIKIAIDTDNFLEKLRQEISIDASEVTEVVGVIAAPTTRTWFGIRGEDVDLSTDAVGLIRQRQSGYRAEKEFRGCDRIFGAVDTCISLLGIAVDGDMVGDHTGAPVDGFLSIAPLTATTPDAQSRGARPEEFVPLISAQLGGIRSVEGSAQLQIEPFCTLQCELPPFDVDNDLVIDGSVAIQLWHRGFTDFRIDFGGLNWPLLSESSFSATPTYDDVAAVISFPLAQFDPYD